MTDGEAFDYEMNSDHERSAMGTALGASLSKPCLFNAGHCGALRATESA
jgi:hypothetical protein